MRRLGHLPFSLRPQGQQVPQKLAAETVNTINPPSLILSPTRRLWATNTRVSTAHVILLTVISASILLYAYTTMRFGHTFITSDGYLYYTHAHSWYFDGDVLFDNNIRAAEDFKAGNTYLTLYAKSGNLKNIMPCGWSIVAFPFLVIADVCTVIHNTWATTDLPRNGYSYYYAAIVPFGHVITGLIGLMIVYDLLRRYFSENISAITTAIVYLGTNTVYFVSVEPTMSHASSFAFVSLCAWATDTIYRSGWTLPRACLLGLGCGMMIAMRYYNVVWILVPCVALLPNFWRQARTNNAQLTHNLLLALTACLVAGLCMLPQIITNLAIEGALVGGVTRYGPSLAHIDYYSELLKAPSGLFVLYPLVIVCILGLLVSLKQRRLTPIGYALLIGLLAHATIYACSYCPGYPRRYTACFVAFAFGFAVILNLVQRWSRGFAYVVILGMACCMSNLALIAMVDQGIAPRDLLNRSQHELSRLTGNPYLRNTELIPTPRVSSSIPRQD